MPDRSINAVEEVGGRSDNQKKEGASERPVSKQSFKALLKRKKNEIILSVIGFILATVIVGTGLALAQEWLKQHFIKDEVTAELKQLDSGLAVFPATNSIQIVQLLSYELSASDLIREIKITAVFDQSTEITNYNVVYSIDIQGFAPQLPQKNYLTMALDHPLDVSRRARIYLQTQRIVSGHALAKLELPDIHIEAKDKNGHVVYR